MTRFLAAVAFTGGMFTVWLVRFSWRHPMRGMRNGPYHMHVVNGRKLPCYEQECRPRNEMEEAA